MKIETFTYNIEDELASDTYVLYDDNKNAVIIDPSVDYDGVINYIERNKLTLKAVLLTHGHFDHIKGVNRVIKHFNVPLYCNALETPLLPNPNLNLSCNYFQTIKVEIKPFELKDNDEIHLLDKPIKVIHTPYHTDGSSCYYVKENNLLFSGDSLFKLSIGRDDLITSNPKLKHSSLAKIMALDNSTKVYPGHGPSTTIGFERTFNRFINR